MAAHRVAEVGILWPKVHYTAFTGIELHLPLLRPCHQVVYLLLELGPVVLVLHHPPGLRVVGKLADDGGGGVHGVVYAVDEDEEQGRAEAAALGDP